LVFPNIGGENKIIMRLSANFTLLSAISGGLSANLGFPSANRIFAVLIKHLIELKKQKEHLQFMMK
jgi:hypothetical protein